MRREVRQYHILRDELIDKLGGKCSICGRKRKLHIDHWNGRDWEPREVSSHMRIKRYFAEYEEGKLRLLCVTCNCSRRYDGHRTVSERGKKDESVPF